MKVSTSTDNLRSSLDRVKRFLRFLEGIFRKMPKDGASNLTQYQKKNKSPPSQSSTVSLAVGGYCFAIG